MKKVSEVARLFFKGYSQWTARSKVTFVVAGVSVGSLVSSLFSGKHWRESIAYSLMLMFIHFLCYLDFLEMSDQMFASEKELRMSYVKAVDIIERLQAGEKVDVEIRRIQ
jgi:hypothetical protein